MILHCQLLPEEIQMEDKQKNGVRHSIVDMRLRRCQQKGET
jgi:hypothetical protein